MYKVFMSWNWLFFRWRIRGVVAAKENVREIKSPKGTFRVFSFTVTDENGNSIKVSAFGAEADKFCPVITNGQVLKFL